MGKHRRGSNSESGMRLLRRLEKNHDGIRSAATRQHYIQIYQAIKYLSLDIAAFIEKGPQMPSALSGLKIRVGVFSVICQTVGNMEDRPCTRSISSG
jgi:hypothetical protein